MVRLTLDEHDGTLNSPSGSDLESQYGGQGAGWIELGIVLEEMGKVLLCAPFFSTVVLAATALLESGDEEAKQQYLPAIADGSLVATVALTEEALAQHVGI
jgi:alkylation response protein AidB-like acyl-CoA dehydrogenase